MTSSELEKIEQRRNLYLAKACYLRMLVEQCENIANTFVACKTTEIEVEECNQSMKFLMQMVFGKDYVEERNSIVMKLT